MMEPCLPLEVLQNDKKLPRQTAFARKSDVKTMQQGTGSFPLNFFIDNHLGSRGRSGLSFEMIKANYISFKISF